MMFCIFLMFYTPQTLRKTSICEFQRLRSNNSDKIYIIVV